MLTAEYLVWYLKRVVKQGRTVSSATSNVYLWLFHKCVSTGRDYTLSTTSQMIADELNISQPTVSRSLITLEQNRIIKRLPDGQIWFLPPDPRWIELTENSNGEYRNEYIMNKPNEASKYVRAKSGGSGEVPPLKGGTTPPKVTTNKPLNSDVNKIFEDAQKPKELSDATRDRMNRLLVGLRMGKTT